MDPIEINEDDDGDLIKELREKDIVDQWVLLSVPETQTCSSGCCQLQNMEEWLQGPVV